MSEYVVNIPFLDQAAAQIKEGGSFSQDLTSQDLAEIMKGVISDLLSGQGKVEANVPQMDVRIQNQQGMIKGAIAVEKPIKAQIGIDLTLGNAPQSQQLKLVKLDVTEKTNNMAAKIALKTVSIKGRAKKALASPNQALFTALSKQLESRDVNLSRIGLNFEQETLGISLQGSSK